ncbi:fumarylacetoacetate hydrolase family protein [Umezakia ovalisporum]|jgi:2-keto-4-pentenoate hydratase/2-oxohepta-3-ene-1,7-dioic acid hydratase in catechol pathway|uniref:Fumarylacetoacetate hydrolase family protein n=2 Tax=Umezakia ovalisporum TaxID=75695 RepID=A0AA43H111_9CYAN|nr:fumarylacetoacetate hydrolase family protein [Umezakia ovalisporum]MDH6058592.1 fumarylacetoacetate hydrolase family protein [Umezakia ovalisporum FSS-43]MDH6064922.1 fumarylacetoacetate hydrolase family protein [Umezakia ovalisporum FSS-62]MDH6067549.1 fumarylacetoacetate hydrolase family protein [Umezakia ovalisporum APH033B]MDH6069515.1 fumarylacetoacetate hydrolase family protein [Umezakia ovalisporum CobakiLakeA]MDH6075357.1 fumarylacetoacetate hydrolase family protein [Umezakia ovalis
MAQRFVRVQNLEGKIYYGLLQLSLNVQVLDAPPWLQGQPTDLILKPENYQILTPCAPSKVVAIGKNYADHAQEMGSTVPNEPLIFLKPPTSLIATETEIKYPPQSQRVDYEGELALVIGDRVCECTPEEAQTKIWGYTIANDVTARDLQQKDGQWTRAKSFDTFCPLGPWIVRELNPGARLQTFLNDDAIPVQSACIDQMVFSPDVIVSYISEIMTLLPGDVVLTGTPFGVGQLHIGDRIRVEIEGIGRLENTVISR